MDLTNLQRKELRHQMLGAFGDADTLDLFVSDNLDIRLAEKISVKVSLELVCNSFLVWAQQTGKLRTFLEAVQADTKNLKPEIRTLAGSLLAASTTAAMAPAGAPGLRAHLISNRPVLNRKNYWDALNAMASGGGGSRVLAVNGGVGKSHSLWPIAHICQSSGNGARLAFVAVDEDSVLNVDAARLATLISKCLWGATNGLEVEDLPQAVRQAKDLAVTLIQRLSVHPEPTWLILDQLNVVNLDPSAACLLGRLCEAVDAGECPKVRLFFFGLDPGKLPPKVSLFLKVDLVKRPLRQDIEEYVLWFAQAADRPATDAKMAQVIDGLNALLADTPDHDNWFLFHKALQAVCESIKEGVLP